MPEVVFPMDNTKSFTEQAIVGHNRWHPDIPAQVSVRPGDTFRVECREWFDGSYSAPGGRGAVILCGVAA